jgi:RND family efflux transporter MFP subunit
MKRAFTTGLALVLGLVAAVALSLVLTGQTFFGLLAGTGLQGRIVPPPVRALLAPGEPGADTGGRARGGPVPVTASAVERASIPQSLSFSGRLLAPRAVDIRARVTGYVFERVFEEATFVDEGAVLYRLDPRTFEARVNELEGALRAARASLEFLRRETERIRELEEEDFAERSRLDELASEEAAAAAQVDELRARLERARLDRRFATVEAPFSGKAGFSRVDEGDLVSAGETVLTTLVAHDPIEVEFRPSAPELAQLRAVLERSGDPIPVTVRLEGDDAAHRGRIFAVGPAFEDDTNTIPVRAELDNSDRALVPGQFARVRADLGERSALLVPTEALVANLDQRAVYRIADGTVEAVPVETGEIVGRRTVVTGDLAAGDRVVTGNLQSVRPGRPVSVTDGAAGAQARARGGGKAGEGP